MFYYLTKVTDFKGITNVNQVTNIGCLISQCNNLSASALNNIYNACINATNVTHKNMNSSNQASPIYGTNKTVPADYKTRLQAAGWTF